MEDAALVIKLTIAEAAPPVFSALQCTLGNGIAKYGVNFGKQLLCRHREQQSSR